mmetsp:Transcript_81184/g.225969  ORF Transcript_81184/g.225969 Transcript_81184/m.225969 type:complete len:206 (+) Transcript_81184:178-795(+)
MRQGLPQLRRSAWRRCFGNFGCLNDMCQRSYLSWQTPWQSLGQRLQQLSVILGEFTHCRAERLQSLAINAPSVRCPIFTPCELSVLPLQFCKAALGPTHGARDFPESVEGAKAHFAERRVAEHIARVDPHHVLKELDARRGRRERRVCALGFNEKSLEDVAHAVGPAVSPKRRGSLAAPNGLRGCLLRRRLQILFPRRARGLHVL